MGARYSREEFAAKLGADGDPKLNAAAEFAARLLNSPVGDRVARILLFGSVARGEASPESDVDLLVIGAGDLESLYKHAEDLAFEMILQGSDYISPMVFGVSDAAYPQTWFLYTALQHGQEVFQMNKAELRRKEAQGWWVLAGEYLQQARRAAQDGSFRLAVDGAYNAAELAVKGLLVLRLEQLPTSHGGLIRVFGREYVITGEVERLVGHRLSTALDLRGKARYNREAKITAEHVAEVAALAQEVVGLLEKTLSALEASNGGSTD